MTSLLIVLLGALYVAAGTLAGIFRFFMIPGPDYFILLPGTLAVVQFVVLRLRKPETLWQKLLLQFGLSILVTVVYLFVIWA